MRWLVVPLIMRDVDERVARSQPTISGLPMSEVKSFWKSRNEGCYEALVDGQWEAISLQEAKKKAQSAARLAFKAVKPLEARCTGLTAPRETAEEAFDDKKSILVGAGVITATCKAFEVMEQLLQQMGKEDTRAFTHVANAKDAMNYVLQVLKAYQPSRVPFAVAMDNCPSHSMTDVSGRLQAIIPMLQVRVRCENCFATCCWPCSPLTSMGSYAESTSATTWP